jgi:hypothetical protein
MHARTLRVPSDETATVLGCYAPGGVGPVRVYRLTMTPERHPPATCTET